MNGIQFIVDALGGSKMHLSVAREGYRPLGKAAVLVAALKSKPMQPSEIATYLGVDPFRIPIILGFAKKHGLVEFDGAVWRYVKQANRRSK